MAATDDIFVYFPGALCFHLQTVWGFPENSQRYIQIFFNEKIERIFFTSVQVHEKLQNINQRYRFALKLNFEIENVRKILKKHILLWSRLDLAFLQVESISVREQEVLPRFLIGFTA